MKTPNNTQQLMVSILKQLGCQPIVNEDDTVTVTYQGEHFHLDFIGLYVHIWDLHWGEINVYDPGLPLLREAINSTNLNFGPTVVITNPNPYDKDIMYLSSRLSLLLHPDIPEVEEYVRYSLDVFFRTKDLVRRYYQRLINEQHLVSERRRPVGFASFN